MLIIDYLIAFIITAILPVLAGYGLTWLLLPVQFEDLEAAFIPFIGVSFLIIIFYGIGAAGGGVAVSAWVVLSVSAALAVYRLFSKRRMINIKSHLALIFLSLPVCILAFYPLVKAGYLTVPDSNMDPVGYSMLSDYLLNNGIDSIPSASFDHPQYQFLFLYFNRFEFAYFNAMAGVFTGLKSYETFSGVTAFFLFLNSVSAYLVCRLLGLGRTAAYIAAILISINGYLLLLFFQGFSPQLIGMSFIGPATVCIYYAFLRQDIKTELIAALFLSALISSYSDALIYAGLPTLFLCIRALMEKGLRATFLTSARIALLSLALNPPGALWAYRLMSLRMLWGKGGTTGTTRGLYEKVGAAFGLIPSVTVWDWMRSTPMAWLTGSNWALVSVILLVLTAVFSIYGFYSAPRHVKGYIYSVGGPYIALTALPYMLDYPYIYYKSLSLVIYLFIILLSSGYVALSGTPGSIGLPGGGLLKGKLHFAALAGILSLVLANLVNSVAISRMYYEKKDDLMLKRDTIGLKDARKAISAEKAVYLPKNTLYQGGTQQLWESYFLSFARVHFSAGNGPNDGWVVYPFQSERANGDYVLERKGDEWQADSTIYEPVWQSGLYRVLRERDDVLAIIDSKALQPFEINGGSHDLRFENRRAFIDGREYGLGRGDTDAAGIYMDYASMDDAVWTHGSKSKKILSGIRRVYMPMGEILGENNINARSFFKIEKITLVRNHGALPHLPERPWVTVKSAADSGTVATKIGLSQSVPQDITVTLDIYDRNNHPEHEGHYGWWSVGLENKAHEVKFILDLKNKYAKAHIDGKEKSVSAWAGEKRDGDYIARVVIRRPGQTGILGIYDAYAFRVAGKSVEPVLLPDKIAALP